MPIKKKKLCRLKDRYFFLQAYPIKKVTGKEHSQDFTDEDLRALMRDIERRENEIDAEFWENVPDTQEESQVNEADDVKPNSPEDLGFVKN